MRSVNGQIVRRWVFNFRIPLDTAAAMLPLPWLTPVAFGDEAMYSYCPYEIGALQLGPLHQFRKRTFFFAAGRLTVRDTRETPTDTAAKHLAWVCGRQSSAVLANTLGRVFLRLPFERARITVSGQREIASGSSADLRVMHHDRLLFGCTVSDRQQNETSGTFESVDEFQKFFLCETSWAPSAINNAFTRLDLDATGTQWRRVAGSHLAGSTIPPGAVFDSAYCGMGGDYTWSSVETIR
jgi:hypothetical protein